MKASKQVLFSMLSHYYEIIDDHAGVNENQNIRLKNHEDRINNEPTGKEKINK